MAQSENTKRIKSYLNYLKDISRKIISRHGFEKALLDKSINDQPYTLQLNNFYPIIRKDNPCYNHYNIYYNYLEKNKDKRLFIGINTIAGKNIKLFAAPLLFAECEIQKKDSGSYEIEINYSSLCINYDLFSIILGNFDISDDEEINENFEKETELFDNMEKALEEIKEYNDYNRINEFGVQIFYSCKKECEQFRVINEFDPNKYNFEIERGLINPKSGNAKNGNRKSVFENDLCFIKANHLFVNRIPDQLSTYEALKKLINEIGEDFKNPALETLLTNSLSEQRTPIKSNNNFEEIERVVNDQLPISLSKNQKRAIINALTTKISYIQGPPGTGKSHTISIIVLASIFLNKKVLIISQKNPALEVVNSMIGPYLNDEEIQGILYYDRESKSQIRIYLKELLKISTDSREIDNKLNNMRPELKTLEEKVGLCKIEFNKNKKDLDDIRKKQLEFTELNENFLQKRQSLEETYKIKFPYNHPFVKIKEQKKYNSILQSIDRNKNNPKENIVLKLFKFKLKNFLINHFKINENWLSDNNFNFFCEDFITLIILYSNAQEKKSELKHEGSYFIRKKNQILETEIQALQKRIIKLKYKIELFEKLNIQKNQDELAKFSNMLFNTKAALIEPKMREINFNTILEIFPFWSAEIRNFGKLFPLYTNLFDLIIVDESSQVNLAEVLPVFYRGGNICIVGDHKQLSLSSTGLTFQLSKRFDNLTWNKYKCGGLSYDAAKIRNLTVISSSILDFIRSPYGVIELKEVLLDEHFRSLPALAQYTNKQFYKEKLKIMTENAKNISLKCFQSINVPGKRDSVNKTIIKEAEEVVKIISCIIKNNLEEQNLPGPYRLPEFLNKAKITIGVISMIRNQCEIICELLSRNIKSEIIEKYEILVGTPEEFQGNEKDIIIFSLCLDNTSIHSINHFQNINRLNVATSRAKYFTYFVYSPFPSTFDKIINYLKYFNGNIEPADINDSSRSRNETEYNPISWKFDYKAYASEFERKVYENLEKYIQDRRHNSNIKIFNQVESCGQKRLDFVLYNEFNKKSYAVEVDGYHHYVKHGITDLFTIEHIERVEILMRAGWNIVHTPYWKWYHNGWLSTDSSDVLKEEIKKIYNELDHYLIDEKII